VPASVSSIHTRTHARTHARTRTRTHTHTRYIYTGSQSYREHPLSGALHTRLELCLKCQLCLASGEKGRISRIHLLHANMNIFMNIFVPYQRRCPQGILRSNESDLLFLYTFPILRFPNISGALARTDIAL
jgi:hypothetical protein